MEEITKPVEGETIEVNSSKRKYGLAGVFIAALLLFLAGASYTVVKIHKSTPSEISPTPGTVSLADTTITYGFWTDTSSTVKAIDLSSGKEAVLADLEKNVKHVKIINGKTISYIKDTDIHDYGKEVVFRDVSSNNETSIIKADNSFGIDDYQVSANGRYASVWMVGISGDKVQFSGSASKVYSVDTQNGERHLLYDETTSGNNPVHYPVAVSDDGTVYTDRFLPNSGAGWGYGMSVSDFSGSNKKDILSMKNGTYSTQPVISPDGKYLAFAGYSGSDGAVETGGYRKALTIPDTLELLDLATLTRKKIDANLNNVIYSAISWDILSNDLQFEAFQNESKDLKTSVYTYAPASKSLTILNDNPKLDFISTLSQGTYLMGQKFPNLSGVGNLGSTYSLSINKLYVVKDTDLSQNPVAISESPIQLIGVEPKSYFPIVDEKGSIAGSTSDRQLKLQTFAINPTLAPQRLTQQSDPIPPSDTPQSDTPPVNLPDCRTITYPQCNQLLGTNYPMDKDLSDINDKAFADCMWQKQAEASAACLDSPLYLYGRKGTQVKVRVGADAYNFNVDAPNNLLTAILGINGSVSVGDKTVQNISYDYISKVSGLVSLDKGWVLTDSDKEEKIEEIGQKLGLLKNEINDVSDYLKTVKSPYLFISFYDEPTSEAILPLYFEPQPQTYKNIVFYIKKLNSKPQVLPEAPLEPSFVRRGLTAVEISYIVE